MMPEETEIEEVVKKPKTMLIVFVAIIINVAIVAVVIFVLKGKGGGGEEEPQAEASAAHGKGHGPGPVVEMSNFVVNIQSAEGSRYLKASIVVELAGETLHEPFKEWEQILRNEVLVHLSSLEVEQTRTVKQKRAIEKHIKDLLNKRIGSEMITGVYFTEFVTQ